MWMERGCDTSNYSVGFNDQKPDVAPVTRARRWRNLIIILTSSRSDSDASATDSFLKLKGREKNKGPLLLLSPGQLTLSAVPCPDGVTGFSGAWDHPSEDTLRHGHVHRAAGQDLLPSVEGGSAPERASALVGLGFKALPAHCPPTIAAMDINFSQISASL